MSLEALISNILNDSKEPLKLYTSDNCSHKDFAIKEIEALVEENENYYNVANFFCLFRVQKWAQLKRKEIKLDLEVLEDAINNNTKFYGITPHGELSFQKTSLEYTDEILTKIENILDNLDKLGLNKSEIACVLDIFMNEEKTSKYIFTTYFKSAMQKIFEKHYEEFNEIADKLEQLKDDVDEDIEVTYHNVENLLFAVSETKDFISDKKCNYDIDFHKTYKATMRVIKTIGEYAQGHDLEQILKYKVNNKMLSDGKIAEKMKRSRIYVKTRYEMSKKIMKYLIWGY